MKIIFKAAILVLGYLITDSTFAQSRESSKSIDSEWFHLEIPAGWIADNDNSSKYRADVILYTSGHTLKNMDVLIRVLAFKKRGENIRKKLETDVNAYVKDYPKVKLKDFEAWHRDFAWYSKLVYVDKVFYHYMVYMETGSLHTHGLSATMSIPGRPATAEEFNAYLDVMASVVMYLK